EKKIFAASDVILNPTSQPSLLYRSAGLHRRVQTLTQPGYRGFFQPAPLALNPISRLVFSPLQVLPIFAWLINILKKKFFSFLKLSPRSARVVAPTRFHLASVSSFSVVLPTP